MTQGIPDMREEPTILGHRVTITASLRGQSSSNPKDTRSDNRASPFAETGEGWKATTPKYNQSKPRCEKTETYAIAPPTGRQ